MRRTGVVLLLAAALLVLGAAPALAANPTAVLDVSTRVSFGAAVPLDGSRSSDPDAGDRIVQYRWQIDTRAVVTTTASTFSHPAGSPALTLGRHTAKLVVVDSSGNQSAQVTKDFFVVDDVAPTAVLDAPGSVAVGDRIPLSGARSSDVGGRVIEFTWTVDGGPPVVTRDNTFTTGVLGPGRHSVTLRVRDDSGNDSAPVSASVFVGDDIPPTAVLDAPATVRVGASIPLSGARSTDVRGRVVRYRWTIDGGAPVETADPAFTSAALPLGRHTVSLVVSDDAGNESTADTKAVVVIDDLAPTAVLDAPATVAAAAPITLSGARSSDLGGRIVSYRWTVDTRPPVVSDGPAFSAPGAGAGTHTVSLVVTDDSGNESAPDTRTVIVPAAPPPAPPTQPKPPTGTRLTTLGPATLLAPAGKKTGLVDLRKGTLVAGRLFSPVATTVNAVFTSGRLKLGSATLKLAAGATRSLTAKLPAAARKALKGKKKLKVIVKAGKVTRTLTLDVK